jgi:hypothetical protein
LPIGLGNLVRLTTAVRSGLGFAGGLPLSPAFFSGVASVVGFGL